VTLLKIQGIFMIQEIKKALNCKIITVTLNPVFDRSLLVPDFRPKGTFIVKDSTIIAAGKGVNVSRSLKNVAIDSTASGILPIGGSDTYLSLLDRERLRPDFLLTEGIIRTNVTIVHPDIRGETHLRERGPHITPSTLNRFKEKLTALIEGETILVLSGSLPDGLPIDTYAVLIDTAKQHGCRVFLDTSKEALKRSLPSKPFFIKPNLEEVRDALGYLPQNSDDLKRACSDFYALGIENVVITRGKDGIVLSRGKEIVSARVKISRPVNAVGSGDAVVAGSIIGVLGGLDTRSAVKLACAFGAANALVSGAGVFRSKDVERLYSWAEALPFR
jgi:1-phosphofructokinase family hexose kinase